MYSCSSASGANKILNSAGLMNFGSHEILKLVPCEIECMYRLNDDLVMYQQCYDFEARPVVRNVIGRWASATTHRALVVSPDHTI